MGKMLLTTKLNQRLLMNQQLTQSINLLQYTSLELKQQIMAVLATNPLIELEDEITEDDFDHTQYIDSISRKNNNFNDKTDDDFVNNIAYKMTLRESLIQQTLNSQFNSIDQIIAEGIIDAIDDNGYLVMSLDEIRIALQTSSQVDITMIEKVLSMIQTFEPAGVAARTTQECLLLQINSVTDKKSEHQYAKQIIETNLLNVDEFNMVKLAKVTGLMENQIIDGLNVIKSLSFYPGKDFYSDRENGIDPELYVRKVNNKWRVYLSESILTRISVNKEYHALIRKNARDKSYKSVLNQLNEAQLFINGIKRRNSTLLDVASYIVEAQQAFFEDGKKALKPLNMIEVADSLECHESTISRITTGKYIVTPHGVFELKFFFPSHIKMVKGDNMSSTAIKSRIENIILHENPNQAYSDDQIALMLKSENIHISRRTVAKYRESLNIPSSYLRPGMNIIKRVVAEFTDNSKSDNDDMTLCKG